MYAVKAAGLRATLTSSLPIRVNSLFFRMQMPFTRRMFAILYLKSTHWICRG